MKTKCYYFIFWAINTIFSIKLKSNIKTVFFLSNFIQDLSNINSNKINKGNNRIKKNVSNLFNKAIFKKSFIIKKSVDVTQLDCNKNDTDKNELSDNNSDNNKDIIINKSKEKVIEQSMIPLNMDWIKVMHLIHASKDVDATTLAFNAAFSAIEKKGCLTTMLEIFEIMKKKNIKPDLISYKLLLSLCDKYHLADHAEIIFNNMVEHDKILPNYEIYSIIISCFAKVGNGHKAIEFFEKLRNDPFVENIKNFKINDDQTKLEKWKNIFSKENLNQNNKENENEQTQYTEQFKEITNKIKNMQKGNNRIQYSEYANVIFACNMANLHEQGIKYVDELLNGGTNSNDSSENKYMPSMFIFENIFELLAKNGNYEKCLEYYTKLKEDPNFKHYINTNILNNILKALSIYNKINVIEDIWQQEFDDLFVVPNSLSYQIILSVYSNTDDYEKAFKLFKEMQLKKCLNKNNILPFIYTINVFKNCGIYNYAIYVLRVGIHIGIVGQELVTLYQHTMITCVNAKKYQMILSLYTELITMQEKNTTIKINIAIFSFVLLAFKELKMKESFIELKKLILQKNYKLTPLCSSLIDGVHDW
ncbi:PPR repeat protein [Hepatocystis sp. ex Piliocolobus tephrosceles]|nr:PPR repeat protein [Hepatocystis sp. ex Piliocolobus tephrosceles]